MHSLGREPAGGSETWPRPGIAGHRPLAGDGASRRPKAVRNPGNCGPINISSPGGATDFTRGVSRGFTGCDGSTARMTGVIVVTGRFFELVFGSIFATVCH